MSLTVPIAEWLEQRAGKQGVAGSIPGGVIYFHFEFFAYVPWLQLGEAYTNKSSMTFIQSNGCKEID